VPVAAGLLARYQFVNFASLVRKVFQLGGDIFADTARSSTDGFMPVLPSGFVEAAVGALLLSR
jgi:hypothetical protein